MEIRQLKYFVGIADTGSFSEASRRFYLSQSAISQQIKILEDELGTQLFTRTPHQVTLTESGNMLLPLARLALQSFSDCKERMNDLNKMLCGELNVGLTYTLEPYVRHAAIRFMKNYPKVQLNIIYKSIPELQEMLRNQKIDMAFSIGMDGLEDEIESFPIMKYRLCAIMRDNHPLATRKQITFKDLEMQNLILPEKGIRDRNAIEEYFSHKASNLRVRAMVNIPEAILNLLQASNYISILCDIIVLEKPNLRAVEIEELSSPVQSYVHFLRQGYRKRSAQVFLKLLQDYTKQSDMPIIG
ncbi:MAG: LysR family transcriptional regulator [Bacteroidaceae bacterium]|nr:LysR family transcriptional regulator [Candidatus Minthousia equi]MCQ2247133.1 LysR family transcriptional regulator [Bacteroidaceae bacterium]